MRILWILRTCPYPANDGEKIRVFNLLRNLSHHEITLVFRVMSDDEIAGARYLRNFCRDVKWVHIPRPSSNLTRMKWVLPFLFSSYPLDLATVYFKEIAGTIQRLCAEISYDIVQIEHSSQSIYLDHVVFRNRPLKIVTMHNIDYIRNERILENMPFGVYKLFYYVNHLRYKKWELSSLRRYDLILTVSETDRDTLLREDGSLPVCIVPNGVDVERYAAVDGLRSAAAHSLVFVASMDSASNNDGAVYFLDSVFPLVRSRYPDACIHLVGRRPGRQLSAYHNNADVFVTGEVADVLPYYAKAAVTVVPLRSGGGTRLKILEAMAAGVPVVSTSVGCEGLAVEDKVHLLIADDPVTFADRIALLFENRELAATIASNARELVRARYDWKQIAKTSDHLFKKAENLSPNPPIVP